jgi:hypothetical protein
MLFSADCFNWSGHTQHPIKEVLGIKRRGYLAGYSTYLAEQLGIIGAKPLLPHTSYGVTFYLLYVFLDYQIMKAK